LAKGELTVCFAQGTVLFYLELEKITNYLENGKPTDLLARVDI
jgi:hypothetical protein